MEKRLYRITRNKMIGGVCSGMAEYFNIDPVLIRLVFVILTFQHGIGILAYIILWIVVPVKLGEAVFAAEASNEMPGAGGFDPVLPEEAKTESQDPGRGSLYGGIVLIVIGTLFLLDNFLPGFGFEDFWPIVLIAVGGGMLWNSWPQRREEKEALS